VSSCWAAACGVSSGYFSAGAFLGLPAGLVAVPYSTAFVSLSYVQNFAPL